MSAHSTEGTQYEKPVYRDEDPWSSDMGIYVMVTPLARLKDQKKRESKTGSTTIQSSPLKARGKYGSQGAKEC